MKSFQVLMAVMLGIVGVVRAAELGAEGFAPSAERPIGWRGDGTGRYPGANPPMAWERTVEGSKGMVWMTPLPNIGVSSPIVVGDRVFLTGEVADLICVDKRTGKVLWIRSNMEFEGMEGVEKATLTPLMADLVAVNAEAVAALDAGPQGAGVVLNEREIEKKINTAQMAIDKKLFERYWGQAVFGFAGPTAITDGKHICAFFTTGVTACYDLDGNRKWIHRGHGGGSEHGNFASPVMCDGKVIVWAQEMRCYDVETGKLLWSNPAKAYNSYGSMFRFKSGGEWVAAFQSGNFARVRDGKEIWDRQTFGDTVTTPIVEGDTLFVRMGYPKNNDDARALKAFKIPASTESGKLVPAYDLHVDWAENEVPVDKQKNPFDRGFVSSALYVDGLIYQLSQGGGLAVTDAASGAVVYRKVPGLKPRTHYWDWSGCSASPTLAGRFIYLMDNQGITLVIKAGREYVEVARNVIEELRDNKEQAQFNATPIFEGTRMYYRTPGYLYCIGQ